jgi:hypothetical protein
MMYLIYSLLAIAAIYLLGVNLSSSGNQPPAPSPAIFAVAKAIAAAEGSNPDWNNPGDLTASFGFPTSGTVNDAGVLKFNSSADGWNALYKQLESIVNGSSRYSLEDTIASFGLGYSGGDTNWAVNVANALGVTPDTQLSDVLS